MNGEPLESGHNSYSVYFSLLINVQHTNDPNFTCLEEEETEIKGLQVRMEGSISCYMTVI